MSVTVNFTSALQVYESINNLGLITQFNHTELNEVLQNLGAGTTPNCTKVATLFQKLSGGAATIDLTNLQSQIGGYTETVDGSNGGGTSNTDYIQFVKFYRPTPAKITSRGGTPDSGGAITIKAGLSNSNNFLGASFLFALQPGQSAMFSLQSLAPDIFPTQKNIALTGTGTDELWCIFVLGGSQ